jgi:RNA polymerase sigma-32 factor
MPLSRAEKLWPLLTQGDVSLDLHYEDRGSAVERMSGFEPDPEECFERKSAIDGVQRALADAMESLSEREQRIVQARMLSDEPCTLEELGHEMGVSKERVRQLEARARRKLQLSLAAFRPAA